MRKPYSNTTTLIDVVIKTIIKLSTVSIKRECIGLGPLKNIYIYFTSLTK